MFPLSNDSYTINKITSFYCMSSCIYLSALIGGLLLTDAFNYTGSYSFLPVYFVIIIAEVLKFIYIQSVNHKELSFNPKQGFKLLTIIFLLLKRTNIVELIKCAITITVIVFVYFFMTILFGADAFGKYEETFMFSILLTVLTVFPLCLHFGSYSVTHLLAGGKMNDIFFLALYRNIQMSLFGAWVGAFVIPLDWHRSWQVWPIPCSTGAIIGSLLSYFISLFQFFSDPGRRSISKLGRKLH
ncbi:phosphatidylinositol-glycan biosynthesis class F protein [Nilaparvata lugens]|uniref:phosphatidylinositol-glycan biosynthesis class F protein n=1 Tax=Nilaparvata lugens TaxID=108931 RepID=UPI000B9940CD|nr:phosphatidylinositol-glycan biosynthesis class F protein [Nilaparvata lugens]XP_039276776.1 phosphatidylinositol-glycan biosynthesis class F protein [Nilaparvata lugens]